MHLVLSYHFLHLSSYFNYSLFLTSYLNGQVAHYIFTELAAKGIECSTAIVEV